MRNKGSLRLRMALWFTLSVLAVTGLFFCALYFTTQSRLNAMLHEDLSLALEQLSSQVEHEQGKLIFENETPVKPGISYFIMEKNGGELASFGEDITLFDGEPIQENEYSRVWRGDEKYLLLDSPLMTVGNEGIRIRVAASCNSVRETLRVFEVIFAFGVPLMTALAALIGFLIASRSLCPIHRIIACADEIAGGDLSRRVPEETSADELGELSRTLNRMLASLESAFQRERRFTSDASHELRTPVAVILAYAESLQSDPSLSADAQAKVEPILRECRRMQRMIEQMLTLTRAQEGRYPVTMEEICLNDVFAGVEMVISERAVQENIDLRFDAPEEIKITADQSLITQMLLNLMENALKYGKSGGHVACRAHRLGDWVQITISDDGVGISEENLPHIFERFFRADTARDRTGTGLGLSIVQWIVQLHRGDVRVTSQLGKGTTFTIAFPVNQKRG